MLFHILRYIYIGSFSYHIAFINKRCNEIKIISLYNAEEDKRLIRSVSLLSGEHFFTRKEINLKLFKHQIFFIEKELSFNQPLFSQQLSAITLLYCTHNLHYIAFYREKNHRTISIDSFYFKFRKYLALNI